MRGYLECMGVTEIAIEAHEKGEADHDTINIIEFDKKYFKIKKQSRVTDMGLELQLGKEFKQTLPGDRVKTVLATSDDIPKSVKVVSKMPTMNGQATVVDTKTLQRDATGKSVCVLLYCVNASVQYGSLGDLAASFELSLPSFDCLYKPHALTYNAIFQLDIT